MATPQRTHGRELVRSRALAVRMALLIVLIPSSVLAAVAAIVLFLPRGWLWALLVGVGIGLLIRGWRHVKARREHTAEHVLEPGEDPELFALVDRLCALIDIERPLLVASELRQANSWVIHRPGKPARLYVTRRLREMLTPEELQAVIGHELTHIANRDALVMTVVETPGSLLLTNTGGGFEQIVFVIIGLISSLGVDMLSRYREFAADAGSAAITGRPSALASALLKVTEAHARIPTRDLRAAVALNAFNLVAVPAPKGRDRRRGRHRAPGSTRSHPPLEKRIEALHCLEVVQQRAAR
jgi:heat shock protein HtpX